MRGHFSVRKLLEQTRSSARSRRNVRATPRLEPLEGRALLSGVKPALVLGLPSIAPPVSQALVLSLTTDHRIYQGGQPVVMILTETNSSQQDITVFDGPSINGFSASSNGHTVWTTNAGPQPLFFVSQTFTPGESITSSVTWNGRSNTGRDRQVFGEVEISTRALGGPTVDIDILDY